MTNSTVTRACEFSIGQKVAWSSAAGHLTGVVAKIEMGRNGLNQLIPWICIDSHDSRCSTRLPAVAGTVERLKLRSV